MINLKISLDEKVAAQLQKRADALGLSLTTYIRVLLGQSLQGEKK